MRSRRLHLALGMVGIVAFLATGQYMNHRWNHLRDMADAPRLLFRSAHIYLLFSSLLNVLLGTYSQPVPRGVGRSLQVIGSVLVAVGPFLFLIAFFREPWLHDLARPFSRLGIYTSFAGALFHLTGALWPADS